MKLLLAMLLSAATTEAGASACTAESAATTQHLIELYTSEGCSSCPPADRWLSELPVDAGAALLAFHVDYWNDLGWPDRYSDARYSARQAELAKRGGNTVTYTPQSVLDGREWRRAWNSVIPAFEAVTAGLRLELRVERKADELHLELASSELRDGAAAGQFAYFAVAESQIDSAIGAGENRGRTLKHDHVVRAYAGPLALPKASVRLDVPADMRAENVRIVAFTQDPKTGAIGQVVQLPLRDCK